MDPYVNEAIKLFDNPEKWQAFLEMSYKKDHIRNEMLVLGLSKLQKRLMNTFASGDWLIARHPENDPCLRWDLKNIGAKDGIGILIGWWGTINLYLWNSGAYDMNKAHQLLEDSSQKYRIITEAFVDAADGVLQLNQRLIYPVSYKYSFDDSPFNGAFNMDQIAWYVANEGRFVEQTEEKIQHLTSNEMTELIADLNAACKK